MCVRRSQAHEHRDSFEFKPPVGSGTPDTYPGFAVGIPKSESTQVCSASHVDLVDAEPEAMYKEEAVVKSIVLTLDILVLPVPLRTTPASACLQVLPPTSNAASSDTNDADSVGEAEKAAAAIPPIASGSFGCAASNLEPCRDQWCRNMDSSRQLRRFWSWQRCSCISTNLPNLKTYQLLQLTSSVITGHAGLLLTWSA